MSDRSGSRESLLRRLHIDAGQVAGINAALFQPSHAAMSDLLDVVERYGTPEEINRKAAENGSLDRLEQRIREICPRRLADLEWLRRQARSGAFIHISDYQRKILGENASTHSWQTDSPVTLEISACQYFSWLMDIAARAIERREIMPARFIRVRNMKEQEADGDLPAMLAAMQIIGASQVEQLDTRGSDGANIHLGGTDTLIGYYGGVGQPNEYALKWMDEFLYYYTEYGVRQVLNVNQGTVLLALIIHRLGIDIEFKVSVTLGSDNPYAALGILLSAALFARPDGTTALAGLNWSNSVTNGTIEVASQLRQALGLQEQVRFEHHVTETWKGLVIQPYLRRDEIIQLSGLVPNLSAKHEGGEPVIEASRERPSEIQDYYRTKEDIVLSGDWERLCLNFLDKFDSLNRTAEALTEQGLAFKGALNLHHADRVQGNGAA